MSIERNAGDFLGELTSAVRENPVSAALIGMGVLWLITGGQSAGKVGSLFGQIPDVARNTVEAASDGLRSTMGRASGVGDALSSATSSAYSQAADFADHASERLGSLPDLGRQMFGSARSGLSDIFEAQPLALGVIGLGIGATIAAALPPTEIESSYLGEASDRLKAQSTDFVGDKFDQAVQTAHDVVGAMAGEAEKQGLTPEGLKSAAGQVSQKVSRVVDSAVASVKDTNSASRS